MDTMIIMGLHQFITSDKSPLYSWNINLYKYSFP